MTRYLITLALILTTCNDYVTGGMNYYVRPSRDVSCRRDPCVTLSQIAEVNFRHLRLNNSKISLSFLPGNHTLDGQLSVAYIDSFTMERAANFNEAVFLECTDSSARFRISQIRFVSIKSVHFIGCGSNTLDQVDSFFATDTSFQGLGLRDEPRGTALILLEVISATIVKSLFLNNYANNSVNPYARNEFVNDFTLFGGALYVAYSNVTIDTTTFVGNMADLGGALFAHDSSLQINQCTFEHNTAVAGGAFTTLNTSLYAESSTFIGNVAHDYGGVASSENDVLTFNNSKFISNPAYSDGVMDVLNSIVNISDSVFSNNTADTDAGVIYSRNSTLHINTSSFLNNRAVHIGGVMYASNSAVNIADSVFSNNTVETTAGVIFSRNSILQINGTKFVSNRALSVSGVMELEVSRITIANSVFTYNDAKIDTAVMWCVDGSMNIANCTFSKNTAGEDYGGVLLSHNCTINAANSTFESNVGSLQVFHSQVHFTGCTNFKNCTEDDGKTIDEGGAITSFKSTIVFTGETSISNNQARLGGGILATDSVIVVDGEMDINANVATEESGGGIYLQRSTLDINGNCLITDNHALGWGGGIHAHSSYVSVYQPGILRMTRNSAKYGGGMSLEVNPKLYLLKNKYSSDLYTNELLFLKDNEASYGGAIYVNDDTNTDACSSDFDCFFQVLTGIFDNSAYKYASITFVNNSATKQASNLYGGLLDRCVLSASAKYSWMNWNTGVFYLQNISNAALDSIASAPVRVCFCSRDGQPKCNYQPSPIQTRKGATFTISLAAVDQVDNLVPANITSFLALPDGGLGEGQHSQSVGTHCTNLTFNVFSPHDSEIITLHPDGPCGKIEPSVRHLEIQFENCSCPIGLKPSAEKPTACDCICDENLSPYIANCTTQLLVLRENYSVWIGYTSDTDPPGYIIHRNCPYDYCRPSKEIFSINLNLSSGADKQCAYNRTGVLCGSCHENLSLSLGSSRCLPCHSYWPAVFVVILLVFIIAGILLVAMILILNMTVAVGLINSFIFYANVVSVSSTDVFPSSKFNLPAIFIAWLNLDIGVDVCFIDGLDAYTKTWLQLAFPVYIISLVIVIIVVSEYSPKFAGMIGKKDPIATLATLIMLSYAKLLSTTISVLSYARLHYPDGSKQLVWLPDGNITYFQGKHTALVIMSILIVIVGLPYTMILFLWQWLVRAPRSKIMAWIRNTKLNAFIAVYHAPYNSKYRYWTGLLLVARVVLYISSSLTICSGPQTSLIITIIVIGCLFLFRGLSRSHVYKKHTIEVIEITLNFNLVVLATVTLSYHRFKSETTQQKFAAYISTIVTVLFFAGVVVYHIVLLANKEAISKIWKKYPLRQFPEQSGQTKVTHSVIEIPSPQRKPEGQFEMDAIAETSGNQIITPPYQE